MNFLKKIGVNSKKAFKILSKTNHKKINSVLEDYNKSILKNKNKIIRENLKDIKNIKRENLKDRLILDSKRMYKSKDINTITVHDVYKLI